MLLEAPQPKRALLSMTPLIDVVFILLLFFMISSSFVYNQQISLNTAQGGAKSREAQGNHLLLKQDGSVWLNRQQYSIHSKAFGSELSRIASEGEPLTAAAESKVAIQVFVSLLDQIRDAGAVNLNVAESVAP